MCPPASVYLAALLSRLPITCASRTGSPATIRPLPGTFTVSWCFFSSISGAETSTARATAVATSSGSRRRSILPMVARETSSRSSTSRVR